jgi:hypothetical protein
MDYFTYRKDCRGILVGFKEDKIDAISYLTDRSYNSVVVRNRVDSFI